MKTVILELEVHPFDIDALGHVSNISFIRWMEIGRCKMLDEVGMPVQSLLENGFGPILAETQISYRKQLKLGDKLRLETWISELSKASAWMAHSFSDGQGTVYASGRQRGLFIDFETNRPKRLETAQRALFEPYVRST